jgi:hypothetical protein
MADMSIKGGKSPPTKSFKLLFSKKFESFEMRKTP